MERQKRKYGCSTIEPPSRSIEARDRIAAALCAEIRQWRIPQDSAAARLGIHRTSLNRMLKGKFAHVSLGHLVDVATKAGIEIEFTISVPIDRPVAEPEIKAASSLLGWDKHAAATRAMLAMGAREAKYAE